MVKEIIVKEELAFQCEECGFKFREEEYAKTCEESCGDKGMCSNEIVKHVIKEENE